MTEWHPIETAPKDGSHVLLHFTKTDKHDWSYCWNMGGWIEGKWTGKRWLAIWLPEHGCDHCDYNDSPEPDAWMTLPKKPNGDTK